MSICKRPPTFRIENEYSPETIPQYFQVCIVVVDCQLSIEHVLQRTSGGGPVEDDFDGVELRIFCFVLEKIARKFGFCSVMICVSVLEARQLIWSRPEQMVSYVVVKIGKKRQWTATKKGQERPFYKEYFVFDLYTCLRDLMRSTVTFRVMEPRCCGPKTLLGQVLVDLASIWNQPDHQLYHKWTLLTVPGDQMSGPRGFLKIDVALMAKWEDESIPMLQPLTMDGQEESDREQLKARFAICVYSASHLAGSMNIRPEPTKPRATFVNIVFSGLVGKTGVSPVTSFPQYNECVSFAEMFPGVNALVRLEIREALPCCARVLASARLLLTDVSHGGHNGFLPTFGPSLLHMYGESSSEHNSLSDIGPFYKGSLLMSLRTTVPYFERGVRTVSLEPIAPLSKDSLWSMEDVCVFCSVLEVSMLDKKYSKKSIGVSISMGHVPDANAGHKSQPMLDDYLETSYSVTNNFHTGSLQVSRKNSAYGYVNFAGKFTILQLNIHLPDIRYCMFKRNMLLGIIHTLEDEISAIEDQIRLRTEHTSVLEAKITAAADTLAAAMQRYMNALTDDNAVDELDASQMRYQYDEMEEIIRNELKNLTSRKVLSFNLKPSKYNEEFSNTSLTYLENDSQQSNENLKTERRQIKLKLAELKRNKVRIEMVVFKLAATWPDIVVWLVTGGTRVAYTKLSPNDCIYSPVKEECGKNCGEIQTLYLKPIKCPKHLSSLTSGCFCIAAKVEVVTWLGLVRQKDYFASMLPSGFELISDSERNLTHLEAREVLVHCQAFIYRAKLQPGTDATGLADTNVRVNYLNKTLETQIKCKTLTPVWNQTLTFTDTIKSSSARIEKTPPLVIFEVFDYESKCNTKLVGRAVVQPHVVSSGNTFPKLQWHSLYKGVKFIGQILLCVRITLNSDFLIDVASQTSVKGGIEEIPIEIQPRLTSYKMDIYWWGLRDVKSCKKPSIILEMDHLSIKSHIIKNPTKNCNFPNGRCTVILQAPLQEDYCPGISLRLYDNTTFGRRVFLGTNVIKDPNKLIIEWIPKEDRDKILHNEAYNIPRKTKAYYFQAARVAAFGDVDETHHRVSEPSLPVPPPLSFGNTEYVVLPMFNCKKCITKPGLKMNLEEKNVSEDWWTKFYCSRKECGDNLDTQKLVIYNSELENQPGFSKFKDWCRTIKLYSEKKTGDPRHDQTLQCGFLKAGIVLYKWPPPKYTEAVTSRGEKLDKGPTDLTGKADPYVVIECGKTKLGHYKERIKQTLNPTFGSVYECSTNMPEDYRMSISLFDYDIFTRDDLIGSTEIDLEDRIYTKHRANCGLALAYNSQGLNQWRDSKKPSKILCQLCLQNNLALPYFLDDQTVVLNGVHYKSKDQTSDEPLENLCLHLLHEWNSFPICGYELVPEHVETRTLYNPSRPGLPQGKIQLWVDIFDLGSAAIVPPAVDITPKKPIEYELRLIVWDAKDVILRDVNLVTHRQSSDVYVKAWLGDIAHAQSTDIHYRSYNGEANFNWRMIFQFWYRHADRQMVLSHAGTLSHDTEETLPPLLHLLLMDNDIFTADDYLGILVLDLNAIPRGAKEPKTCTLTDLTAAAKVDIFKSYSLRGWWPVKQINKESGDGIITGKLDLELQLLSRHKAAQLPVGRGHEPPHPMPAPNRPDSSFNFYSDPLKAAHQYIQRRGWVFYLVVIIILLLVLFLLTTYLMLPQIILKKLTGLR